jgi:hypothetical protein
VNDVRHALSTQAQRTRAAEGGIVGLLHIDGGRDAELLLDLRDGAAESRADVLVGDDELQLQAGSSRSRRSIGFMAPKPPRLPVRTMIFFSLQYTMLLAGTILRQDEPQVLTKRSSDFGRCACGSIEASAIPCQAE